MIEARYELLAPELLQHLLSCGEREGFRVLMTTDGRLTIQRVGLADGLIVGPSMYPPPAFEGSILEGAEGGSSVVGDLGWPPGWQIALAWPIAAGIALLGSLMGAVVGRADLVLAVLVAAGIVFVNQRGMAWWMDNRRAREELRIREFLATAAPMARTTSAPRRTDQWRW